MENAHDNPTKQGVQGPGYLGIPFEINTPQVEDLLKVFYQRECVLQIELPLHTYNKKSLTNFL